MRQFLALCAIGAGLAGFGYAEQKFAVINIQGAIVSTKDGQKAAAELQSKAAPKQKAIEAKQNEINSLKDQLQKGQNTLSETAKNDLYRTIDQKTKSLNRDMEDTQAELDQEQQKILQDLGQKMMAVISKYANENGYTMVLDVSSPQTPVVFASTGIDITKDIIELYDKTNGGTQTTTTLPAPGAAKPPASGTTGAANRTAPAPGTTARPSSSTTRPGTPAARP